MAENPLRDYLLQGLMKIQDDDWTMLDNLMLNAQIDILRDLATEFGQRSPEEKLPVREITTIIRTKIEELQGYTIG